MTGRRTTAGLSLLCALLVCAFAAQSASAAKAVNTTAFTCSKGGGNLDFNDPHCDEKVTAGTGDYGHVAIENNTTTEIEAPKVGVNATLVSTTFGVKMEVSCTTTFTTGSIHNVESESKKHTVTGEVTAKFSGCTVVKPPKCVVAEPITVKATYEGVEGIGAGKEEMGIELKPTEGSSFTSLEFKDKGAEKCSLAGKAFTVHGAAIATGSPAPNSKHTGSTANLTDERTTSLLALGGASAGFSMQSTVLMSGFGNPMALTTVT